MKVLISVMLAVALFSCGPSDENISKEVTTSLASSGGSIASNVNKGVVTLSGTCPDEPCKVNSESAVRNVKGVKEVVNNITVTPPAPEITINPDDALNTALNSVVSSYKNVKATVEDGVVTLTGEIKRSELAELMQKVTATNPKKIENKLEIK